jgi:hypothetical protein
MKNMKKVKKYLDENFIKGEDNKIILGGNKEDKEVILGDWSYEGKNESCVCVTINNETLQLRCKLNGKYIDTLYGYLQTYKHLPRGEADKNGYYKRSTDEEVIKYIEIYVNKVNVNNYMYEWMELVQNKEEINPDFWYEIPGIGAFKNLEFKLNDEDEE